MIENYIKFALRFLRRHKLYTFINILSLTVGMASCLLILGYVQKELAYDTFHQDAQNIYRVNMHVQGETELRKASAVSPPMARALEAEIPEVSEAVRLRHANNVLIRIGEEQFYEDQVFYADSNFFNLFDFPLVSGAPGQVLNGKNKAVIGSRLADKYFAGTDPIGKVLTIDESLQVEITGVMGQPSAKSHLDLAMLISFTSFEIPHGYPVTLQSWQWTSFPTYVRLHSHTSVESLEDKLHNFVVAHMGEETAKRLSLQLQPVEDIHLKSKDIIERDGQAAKGDITYVYGLTAIAFLILGIAVFNFANLSTTLSLKRIREIGVRKTLGAKKGTLFIQHLSESLLLSALSFILAVALLEICSGYLSQMLQTDLSISLNTYLNNAGWAIALVLVLALIGGLYPAWFLSSYSPTKALKGKVGHSTSRFSIKNILVVFQFFITIGLIASSIIINKQMNYLASSDLGFDKERVIAVQMVGEELNQRYTSIKQHLLQNSNVARVSAGGNLFDGQNGSVPIMEQGKDESTYRISLFGAHYGFSELMDLEFVEGRDFSDEYANDSSHFILNEAAVKAFGWGDSPIGKTLVLNGAWQGEVIGVVRDFHYASMHEHISPLVLFVPRTYQEYVFVKLNAGNIPASLASIRDSWHEVNPDMPFDYKFVDEHIEQLYTADQQFMALINSFSVLSILLACLGLYGMVSFTVEARMKEIGIRKVLGASVAQIVTLLSKKFGLLIAISACMVLPLTWYLLQNWLTNFAYQISPSWVILLLSVLITIVLAAVTISLQTINAALANPVHALKEE